MNLPIPDLPTKHHHHIFISKYTPSHCQVKSRIASATKQLSGILKHTTLFTKCCDSISLYKDNQSPSANLFPISDLFAWFRFNQGVSWTRHQLSSKIRLRSTTTKQRYHHQKVCFFLIWSLVIWSYIMMLTRLTCTFLNSCSNHLFLIDIFCHSLQTTPPTLRLSPLFTATKHLEKGWRRSLVNLAYSFAVIVDTTNYKFSTSSFWKHFFGLAHLQHQRLVPGMCQKTTSYTFRLHSPDLVTNIFFIHTHSCSAPPSSLFTDFAFSNRNFDPRTYLSSPTTPLPNLAVSSYQRHSLRLK